MQIPPPKWSDEQLQEDIAKATQAFVLGAAATHPKLAELHSAIYYRVTQLLADSEDLRKLTPEIISNDREYRWDLGYCVMPPVSQDNLRTIVGNPLRKAVLPNDIAQSLIDAITPVVDAHRFPWLAEERAPTRPERVIAVEVTAALLASERIRTLRRTEPAMKQQEAVSQALISAGYTQVPKPGRIDVPDKLERGTFCAEVNVGPESAKADRPVRLRDGRLLAIGCKVTNSNINSRKRLLKDIASDAASWEKAFGKQCIPAAVIAGVIDLATLKEAQGRNTFIVWQHNLQPLIDFVTDVEASGS